MGLRKKLTVSVVVGMTLAVMSLSAVSAYGETDPAVAAKARRLYSMLTRGSLQPENPLYAQIIAKVASGDYVGAGQVITGNPTMDPTFYDVAIRQFASSTFSLGENPSRTLDEGTAYWIGSTRDGFSMVDGLTGAAAYTDPTSATAFVPSLVATTTLVTSTAHYAAIDAAKSPTLALVRMNVANASGALTSQAPAGTDLWQAGTKRRVYKSLVQSLWGTRIEDIQNPNLPSLYLRRDHTAADAPNGDLTGKCLICHARMDATYGALTNYKWNTKSMSVNFLGANVFDDQLSQTQTTTYDWSTNNQWHFFYTDAESAFFGVPASLPPGSFDGVGGIHEKVGNGLTDFLTMMAASDRFNIAMATRVVYQVYLGKIWTIANLSPDDKAKLAEQSQTIAQLAQIFKNNGQKLPDLFVQAVNIYMNR